MAETELDRGAKGERANESPIDVWRGAKSAAKQTCVKELHGLSPDKKRPKGDKRGGNRRLRASARREIQKARKGNNFMLKVRRCEKNVGSFQRMGKTARKEPGNAGRAVEAGRGSHRSEGGSYVVRFEKP